MKVILALLLLWLVSIVMMSIRAERQRTGECVMDNDFILEQELDEQESICDECGNIHSCSTICWYDEEQNG